MALLAYCPSGLCRRHSVCVPGVLCINPLVPIPISTVWLVTDLASYWYALMATLTPTSNLINSPAHRLNPSLAQSRLSLGWDFPFGPLLTYAAIWTFPAMVTNTLHFVLCIPGTSSFVLQQPCEPAVDITPSVHTTFRDSEVLIHLSKWQVVSWNSNPDRLAPETIFWGSPSSPSVSRPNIFI